MTNDWYWWIAIIIFIISLTLLLMRAYHELISGDMSDVLFLLTLGTIGVIFCSVAWLPILMVVTPMAIFVAIILLVFKLIIHIKSKIK